VSDVPLLIVGLGPAGLDRVATGSREALAPDSRTVIVRTLDHPAAAELAAVRSVISCDDLYETAATIDEVYQLIAARVIAAADRGPTVYAVPGSAVVGERAVATLRRLADERQIPVVIHAGESFLDLAYLAAGIDPIARSVKIVNARELPDPLIFDAALVVTQVDRREVLADVAAGLSRVLADDTPVLVLDRLGDPDETIMTVPLSGLSSFDPGPRTTLVVDPGPAGWFGLVTTNRVLRRECPWDRTQTHHSLLTHLIEEAYETVDALRALPPEAPGGEPDFGVYAEVEEELGDLLLQVVFHATLAREVGAFDVEEVAEMVRRKLVRRHPHVFGEVIAEDPATVIQNWETIKGDEKQRESLMDDIPRAMPAMLRADKMQRRAKSVGFDWEDPAPVLAKVAEELRELTEVLADPARATAELGDVLFAVANLARHLGIDPEVALEGANDRFSSRFRAMEAAAAAAGRSLAEYSLDELDALWERAKADRAGN
jgi:tetrapyrrole methylase family protein/MazG family protein